MRSPHCKAFWLLPITFVVVCSTSADVIIDSSIWSDVFNDGFTLAVRGRKNANNENESFIDLHNDTKCFAEFGQTITALTKKQLWAMIG